MKSITQKIITGLKEESFTDKNVTLSAIHAMGKYYMVYSENCFPKGNNKNYTSIWKTNITISLNITNSVSIGDKFKHFWNFLVYLTNVLFKAIIAIVFQFDVHFF